MQSKATIAFASGLADAKWSVKMANEKLNIIKVNRKMIGKVMRSIEKLIDPNDRMYLMTNNNLPHVYINMRGLESFKDDKLMMVLGYLSETMDNMKTEDWAASVNRDYRFTSSTHSVVISAYVRDDSPTCRKVLVGTELQTVEKFEIVCD
jgi:hypothetical protein